MLPGRKYTPQDIVHLLLQWKWLVLVPWVIATGAAFVYARSVPDQYRSESVIQVVPQRVPEDLVRSTVTARITERLPAISQQILSRTRLERIINDFDLYAVERKTRLMEEIVTMMRADVSEPEMVKGDAFRISYVSSDAKMAMKVTERLASLFVEENLRDREVLAEGANQFLASQLDDARRRLLEHEKKLEEFRRQHNGQLPSQLAANVQAIQNAQNQMQALNESIIRDRDRRLVIERMVADAEVEAAQAAAPPVVEGRVSRPAAPPADQGPEPPARNSAAVQLEGAQASLATLLLRLKPEHPDVIRLQRAVRDLERRVEADALQTPLSPAALTAPPVAGAPGVTAAPPPRRTAAELLRQNRMRELKTELETLDREIARKTEAQRRIERMSTDLERRIDQTPTRESELTALTRDYQTLQGVYSSLLGKSEEAKVAANLERRQIGEQFKVIDAARLPEQPFSPNRPQIVAAGLAGGLIFGLALIALIEYRDNSFRTDDEIVALLALPVVAMVPTIVTGRERRARVRLRLLLAATAVVLAGAGTAVALRFGLTDTLALLERLR